MDANCNVRLQAEARRAPALAALRAKAATRPPGLERSLTQPSEVEQSLVALCPPPFTNQPAKGSCARGLAYERKVGRVLKTLCIKEGWKLWDHQWFVYKNGNEIKYFQPDFIIERKEDTVLLEVKLTFVDTTLQTNRYLEYLKLFGLNCFPVTIVRHLTPFTPAIITEFSEMTPNAVLHLWL